MLGCHADGMLSHPIRLTFSIIAYNCKYIIQCSYGRCLSFSFGKSYYISTHSVYVKYVGYKLKVPHRRDACNCSLTNNILYTVKKCVYYRSTYQIFNALQSELLRALLHKP